jgi:hypothetical protein
MTFDEFADTAADLFGFDVTEANTLASQLDDAGLDLESYDADDAEYWADVSDALGEEDFEVDELDPFFPGDEWLEPDIEWEMTAESEEGYGDD